jgi:hypothetical protein
MISYLEELVAGKVKKLAIITPPRFGKTMAANILVPAYCLGRNPAGERIISTSYGSELSEVWGRRVRNLLNDPAYREVFPACQLSPDSQAIYRFEQAGAGRSLEKVARF